MKSRQYTYALSVFGFSLGILSTNLNATTTRYYTFETEGGVGVSNGSLPGFVDDSSGNNLPGAGQGTTFSYATSPFNAMNPYANGNDLHAIYGNASTTGAGVRLTATSGPIIPSVFTFETFFRFDSTDPNTGDVKQLFYCNTNIIGTPSPFYVYLWNQNGTGGTNDLRISLDGDIAGISVYDLQPNTNYFLATTYNGSDMNVYLNGTLAGTQAYSGFAGSGNISAMIGNNAVVQGRGFTGYLGDVRISDNVLQPNQFLNVIPEPTSMSLIGIAAFALTRRSIKQSIRAGGVSS